MQDNNTVHRFIVPVGYTLAWCLGILLGCDFFDLYGHKVACNPSDPSCVLFYSAISVYIAFLMECFFVFIDCGSVYETERFNGRVFYILAAIMLHFFVTVWLIGALISKMDAGLVYFMILWISLFKLGISLIQVNVKYWLADVSIRAVISNQIR